MRVPGDVGRNNADMRGSVLQDASAGHRVRSAVGATRLLFSLLEGGSMAKDKATGGADVTTPGDVVDVVGAIDKIDTFTSKGGGFHIKISCSSDPQALAQLAANLERIVDVRFAFRATYRDSSEDGSTPDMFGDDGESEEQ